MGVVSLVSHAIAILSCFSEQEPELRLSDISRRLGISTSHTHRLLSTLVEEGLLRRGLSSPRYRLGLRLVELGRLATHDSGAELAFPAMVALGQRTGETILFGVRDGPDVVFLHRVESPNVLRASPALNRRYSAWAATGQALLAWEDKAEIDYVIRNVIPPAAEDAEARLAVFLAGLAATRQLGYAVSNHARGVRAVSAPVHNQQGRVVAALTLVAPVQRLARHRVPAIASLAMRSAEEISDQLASTSVRFRPATRAV